MKGQLIRALAACNLPLLLVQGVGFRLLSSLDSLLAVRRVSLEHASVRLPRTWCHCSPGPIQDLSRTLHKATFLVEAVVVLAGGMGSCGGHNLFCGYLALQSVCTPHLHFLSQSD